MKNIKGLHLEISKTGFLPGFLWQVRIKAKVADFQKVAEFYTQPAKPSKKVSAAGGCKGGEPPLHRKFLDFGCRI